MVNINRKMVNVLGDVNLAESQSIHALAQRTNEPYTSVYRQIVLLSEMGVVTLQQKGRTQFLSLDFANELTRHVLSTVSCYRRESAFNQHPLLKIITRGFACNAPLLLFGSYARQTARKDSDIDLCAIGLHSKDEKVFKRALRQIEQIHSVEINCLFLKKSEFVAMVTSKSHNVGKEIALNHLVLRNADLWFNLIAEVHDELRL